MKAKHALQIRLGIALARMNPFDATLVILTTRRSGLTSRAFRRECGNVVRRLVHDARVDPIAGQGGNRTP